MELSDDYDENEDDFGEGLIVHLEEAEMAVRLQLLPPEQELVVAEEDHDDDDDADDSAVRGSHHRGRDNNNNAELRHLRELEEEEAAAVAAVIEEDAGDTCDFLRREEDFYWFDRNERELLQDSARAAAEKRHLRELEEEEAAAVAAVIEEIGGGEVDAYYDSLRQEDEENFDWFHRNESDLQEDSRRTAINKRLVEKLQITEVLEMEGSRESLELAMFIRDYPDDFMQSIRNNTAIKSLKIDFYQGHESPYISDIERIASVIAESLRDKPAMKHLTLTIHGTYDYELLPLFLHLFHKEITSFHVVLFIDTGAPPLPSERYDAALKRCSKMEDLQIAFYNNGTSPFPTSIPALSKLQKLKFLSRDQEVLAVLDDFDSIGNALMFCPNLKELTVSGCHVSGNCMNFFFNGLGWVSSLENLVLSCPNDIQFYSKLSRAMSINRSVTDVGLYGHTYDELDFGEDEDRDGLCSQMGLCYMLNGFKISDTIKNLSLCHHEFNDHVCEGLNTYLAASTSLEALAISYTRIAPADLSRICTGVAHSSGIKKLVISCARPNSTPCFTVQDSIEFVTLLKNNHKLETLVFLVELHFFGVHEALIRCVAELGVNSPVKMFKIERMLLGPVRLSLPDGERLVEILSKNLSLAECPFSFVDNVSAEDRNRVEKMARTICKLNNFGRSYLIEGKSKNRGVALLAAIADDLDCIYFHLLENPALCENNRSTSHGWPQQNKKRTLAQLQD